MRVLVHGAGAVGGYFGALLARGGHEVWFVARGENLAALKARGLTVRLDGAELHVAPVQAVADPSAAPPPDLILVCVKSYDTPAAAGTLRPVVGPETIVLSLQNGIENEELLARGLGLPPLLVALTRIGVALVAPAVVAYSGRGTILYGEPDGSESPRARRVADGLRTANVPFQLRRDVLVAAWEKLAWNAAFNAVTALTRTTVAQALALPATRDLIVAAMEEVDAVATASGVPVRRTRTDAVLEDSATGLPDFHTSMLQDVLKGRRLEHDAINGAVVRAATRAGIAAPVNATLVRLLARLDPAAAR
ncbi:MAG TPA: 2-dehydropantoate 2-reductase [Candidatus Binatia bacterium]|nr:2-dehydropantoate 2-reductase [Candidatus Binatia bacterium]